MGDWEYEFSVKQVRDWDDPEYTAIAQPYWDRWYTLSGEEREAERGKYPKAPLVDRWTVSLPHQCDAWTITYEDTHEEAVRLVEEFIAKAQAALEALKERREQGQG